MSKPRFTLATQLPKAKVLGVGVLSVSESGEAHFFDGTGDRDSRLLAAMHRIKLEFAGADGIFIAGMEANGVDRIGRQKFCYQQWWLRYYDEPENNKERGA